MIILAYLFFCYELHFWWQIDLPGWWELFPWVGMQTGAFPTTQLTGWSLLALAFPLGAQLLFERAEI